MSGSRTAPSWNTGARNAAVERWAELKEKHSNSAALQAIRRRAGQRTKAIIDADPQRKFPRVYKDPFVILPGWANPPETSAADSRAAEKK
jgi:hypothetical protein